MLYDFPPINCGLGIYAIARSAHVSRPVMLTERSVMVKLKSKRELGEDLYSIGL